MLDASGYSEKDPLLEDDDPKMMHPSWAVWLLQYTCTLPFVSCCVALITGFYGMACLAFCLGLTSVGWWWYPYKENWIRYVDRCCILLCGAYAFYVEEHVLEPYRLAWRATFLMVCSSVLVNECAVLCMKTLYSEEEHQRSLAKYTLTIHAFCAHIVLNVLTCGLMITYVILGHEASIKFRDASDGPKAPVSTSLS